MTDWHPFKVGMTADRVLDIAKRRRYRRVARNEIVATANGRVTVKWHFEACTLLIGFDLADPPYRVQEILEPLETGEFLTRAQASPSPEEIEVRIAELESAK